MLEDIFFALWFFLPAGVANAVPILVVKLPLLKRWNAPMDLGMTYRGKRVLGSHKTWRGLVSGIIAATLVLWLQQYLVGQVGWVHDLTDSINYASLPTLLLGPLFALGALGGDAIESFFKRQHGVAPGHGWFPFDQIDYIIGGAIATMPFVALSIGQYAWLLLLWLLMHIVGSAIGYMLGLKERPI